MKANYFQIRELANNWASAYKIQIFKIAEGRDFFYIYTSCIEIGFDNLVDLASDLADHETSIHSICKDVSTQMLTITIYK